MVRSGHQGGMEAVPGVWGPWLQSGVALPHGRGLGVTWRARDLPPAPAQVPGCARAAGTQLPLPQGGFRGCFGRCTFVFTQVDGQGFPQWDPGLHSTHSLPPLPVRDPQQHPETLLFGSLTRCFTLCTQMPALGVGICECVCTCTCLQGYGWSSAMWIVPIGVTDLMRVRVIKYTR